MGAKDHGTRVWKGDPKTVAEARERYWKNPGEIVPYVVALYSFRNHKRYADELMEFWATFYDAADYELDPGHAHDGRSAQEVADRADVLSTILEWMSRQPAVRMYGVTADIHTLRLARLLCELGIGELEESGLINHTLVLLHLTAARICFEDGQREQAREHLRIARNCVALGRITDPNQLARARRKLGMIYRMSGERLHGIVWGIQAIFTRGTTMHTRAKSLAALLGVDA